MIAQEIFNLLALLAHLDDGDSEDCHSGGKEDCIKFWKAFWEVYNKKGSDHLKIERNEFGFKIFADEETFFGVRCLDGKLSRVRRTVSGSWTHDYAPAYQGSMRAAHHSVMAELEAEAG